MLVENCSRGVFIDHSIGDAMSLNAVTCLAFFREEHRGALCCRLFGRLQVRLFSALVSPPYFDL